MTYPRREHFEVVSSAQGESEGDQAAPESGGRPWIGIHFECCGVYTRVYRHPDSRRYLARCPSCGRSITIRVAPDGMQGRFFRAR